MNKFLLLTSLSITCLVVNSQTILKHSTTENITSGNSVSCSASGVVVDNYLTRRFDLDNFGIVDTAFIINLRFAVESSTIGPYQVRARVYELVASPFTFPNMSYIIGDTLDCYVDSTAYYLETDYPQGSYALPGDTLVTEIFTPADGVAGFWMGSNNLYESDTSFMTAPGCGYFQPTPVHNIGTGFPNCHWLMFLAVNQRPKMTTVEDWVYKNDTLAMNKIKFHTGLLDEDFDDTITICRIEGLPSNGILEFQGAAVAIGDSIYNHELIDLEYIPTTDFVGLDTFMIRVMDQTHWSNAVSPVEIEVVDWVAGVEESVADHWEIYPNPVRDELTISGIGNLHKMRVVNAQGQTVLSTLNPSSVIYVAALESGTYFLECYTDKGRFTKQFVKE